MAVATGMRYQFRTFAGNHLNCFVHHVPHFLFFWIATLVCMRAMYASDAGRDGVGEEESGCSRTVVALKQVGGVSRGHGLHKYTIWEDTASKVVVER